MRALAVSLPRPQRAAQLRPARSWAGDTDKQLHAPGGAKVVLATVASAAAMSATIDGQRYNGELIAIGVTIYRGGVTYLHVKPPAHAVTRQPHAPVTRALSGA